MSTHACPDFNSGVPGCDYSFMLNSMSISQIAEEEIGTGHMAITNQIRFIGGLNCGLYIHSSVLVEPYYFCTPYFHPLLQCFSMNNDYCQISNIGHTLVGNTIVDHPAVVAASPVGAVLTSSSFWIQFIELRQLTARRDETHLRVGIWCVLY